MFGDCKCGSTSCAALIPGMESTPTPFGTWEKPTPEEHTCWCARCNPCAWWMVTCGLCGDKRCPKAVWHEQECAAVASESPVVVVMPEPTEQCPADVVEAQKRPERMPLFLTGWRYITTAEEADALPIGAVAIIDDAFLWDADCSESPIVPELRIDYWDGVVDVQERDFIHMACEGMRCTDAGCRMEWFETNDSNGSPRPPLPFFAWHPTFCVISAGSVGEVHP